MAIFHYSAQILSRKQQRSAVAAAAYRAGVNLYDERHNKTHRYSRKKGVVGSEIIAPRDAPPWIYDREQLWNQVETIEKRKDSQVAREVNVALPVELTLEQNIELLRGFIYEQYTAKGVVADYSIHLDDPANPHAHILSTTRPLEGVGQDKTFGKKLSEDWNKRKETLEQQRELWATHVNRALESAGVSARIDHRSFEDQGIEDRLPQIHLGPHVAAMRERGIKTRKGTIHDEIDQLNQQLKANLIMRADIEKQLEEESAREEEEARFREEKLARDAAPTITSVMDSELSATKELLPVPSPVLSPPPLMQPSKGIAPTSELPSTSTSGSPMPTENLLADDVERPSVSPPLPSPPTGTEQPLNPTTSPPSDTTSNSDGQEARRNFVRMLGKWLSQLNFPADQDEVGGQIGPFVIGLKKSIKCLVVRRDGREIMRITGKEMDSHGLPDEYWKQMMEEFEQIPQTKQTQQTSKKSDLGGR